MQTIGAWGREPVLPILTLFTQTAAATAVAVAVAAWAQLAAAGGQAHCTPAAAALWLPINPFSLSRYTTKLRAACAMVKTPQGDKSTIPLIPLPQIHCWMGGCTCLAPKVQQHGGISPVAKIPMGGREVILAYHLHKDSIWGWYPTAPSFSYTTGEEDNYENLESAMRKRRRWKSRQVV